MLDQKLVAAAKNVKVLSAIAWAPDTADHFLEAWRQGKAYLPEVPQPTPIDPAVMDALDDVIDKADTEDPVGRFLAYTALSYRRCGDLLSAGKTPEYHRISRELYGGPGGRLAGATMTHRQAAERLMESTTALYEATRDDDDELLSLTSEQAAARLSERIDGFFDETVEVVVDDNLSAKAAASASRVRMRGKSRFSEQDVAQLAEHEVFVHSLTALNGRSYQPHLESLGLGAPRTTATQEGLATFAELVTGTMDLARLRRISLRIRAIHLAEEGADFIQLVDVLVEAGETPMEAVQTAMRVFRGGDPRGRYVFTKDTVYLKGLFAVHTFLRKAIAERKPWLVPRLFVGRVTLGDVLKLEEAFEDGLVAPARYTPGWAANLRSLAAFLVVSALVDQIDLRALDLEDVQLVVSPRSRIDTVGLRGEPPSGSFVAPPRDSIPAAEG